MSPWGGGSTTCFRHAQAPPPPTGPSAEERQKQADAAWKQVPAAAAATKPIPETLEGLIERRILVQAYRVGVEGADMGAVYQYWQIVEMKRVDDLLDTLEEKIRTLGHAPCDRLIADQSLSADTSVCCDMCGAEMSVADFKEQGGFCSYSCASGGGYTAPPAPENPTCSGCRDNQPNQMAHMDPGGCLYSEEF